MRNGKKEGWGKWNRVPCCLDWAWSKVEWKRMEEKERKGLVFVDKHFENIKIFWGYFAATIETTMHLNIGLVGADNAMHHPICTNIGLYFKTCF